MSYYKRILDLLEYTYGCGLEDAMEDNGRSMAGLCYEGIESVLYFYKDVIYLVYTFSKTVPGKGLTEQMLLRIYQLCNSLSTKSEMAGVWAVEETVSGAELTFSMACPTFLPPELAAQYITRAMSQVARQKETVENFIEQTEKGIVPSPENKTEVCK